MADSNEISNKTEENYRNCASDADSDCEEPTSSLQLDLGDELTRNTADSNRLGNVGISSGFVANDISKREENPFSFKHFLRSDSSSSAYQNKGARPKVFCEGRSLSSVSDMDLPLPPMQELKQSRIAPEYSSALPDFVQDHLVIEQCYLGNNPASNNFNLDINLPDFAPNRINSDSSHSTKRQNDNDLSIPLDLPVRPQAGFPLDLPITGTPVNGSRSCSSSNEVGVSKSLPDFLADGAVRSSQNSLDGSAESPERDYDRLRRELDITRSQLADQTRRVENLSRELEISRNNEHDYTQNLAKALEQVEENLERSNMRSASAENTILKLKQELKSLEMQVNRLQQENRLLRGEEGAAGGGSHDYYSTNELHSQRLAQELKAAASTAEHSLRQLLTGVDNLRIMAASLENLHRIEEKRETFLDLDEDSGPAL